MSSGMKNTNLDRMPSRVLECVHGCTLACRAPAWGSVAVRRRKSRARGKGAVGPSPGGSPPVPDGPRAWGAGGKGAGFWRCRMWEAGGPGGCPKSGAGVCGSGKLLRGQDHQSRSYLIQEEQLRCTTMPEQIESLRKKEEKTAKGLTFEQRRHLENSLKENEELMKCLAEM